MANLSLRNPYYFESVSLNRHLSDLTIGGVAILLIAGLVGGAAYLLSGVLGSTAFGPLFATISWLSSLAFLFGVVLGGGSMLVLAFRKIALRP